MRASEAPQFFGCTSRTLPASSPSSWEWECPNTIASRSGASSASWYTTFSRSSSPAPVVPLAPQAGVCGHQDHVRPLLPPQFGQRTPYRVDRRLEAICAKILRALPDRDHRRGDADHRHLHAGHRLDDIAVERAFVRRCGPRSYLPRSRETSRPAGPWPDWRARRCTRDCPPSSRRIPADSWRASLDRLPAALAAGGPQDRRRCARSIGTRLRAASPVSCRRNRSAGCWGSWRAPARIRVAILASPRAAGRPVT